MSEPRTAAETLLAIFDAAEDRPDIRQLAREGLAEAAAPLTVERLATYRRTFLDIATAAGEDTSGIEHPDQLVNLDISEYALRAVKQLKQDYDEALAQLDAEPRRRANNPVRAIVGRVIWLMSRTRGSA